MQSIPCGQLYRRGQGFIDVTLIVFWSRDVKNNIFFQKKLFVQKVKVKGQSQGQGQMKVKGQGHVKFLYCLHFFIAVLMNLCKKFINAL